jgi:tetratricopeptide (TPR) repeat protein
MTMRGILIIGLLLAAIDPAAAQNYRQLSQWCFGDASDAETIKGCNAVIRWARERPRDAAAAFYNRGMAWRNQGKIDRAIDDYDQALRLRPTFAEAWNERGIAVRLQGNSDRALADFGQAIRLNPDLAAAWFNRGATWLSLGRFDLAVADFDRALALQPDDAEVIRARGQAMSQRGN